LAVGIDDQDDWLTTLSTKNTKNIDCVDFRGWRAAQNKPWPGYARLSARDRRSCGDAETQAQGGETIGRHCVPSLNARC